MEQDDDVLVVAYATFPRRLLAMSVDVLVVVGIVLAGAVVMTFVPSVETIILSVSIGAAFMYEPLMVSQRAGTLGHYAMNLRVYRQDSQDKVSLLAAIARMWLKMFLGVLSFLIMAVTRRFQSLHDVATKSVVVIHDLSKAQPYHYHEELDTAPGVGLTVSPLRRILVIVGYAVIIFIAGSIVSAFVLSEPCLMLNQCNARDEKVSNVLGAAMIFAWGAVAVVGWVGKLPGAREKRAIPSSELNGV